MNKSASSPTDVLSVVLSACQSVWDAFPPDQLDDDGSPTNEVCERMEKAILEATSFTSIRDDVYRAKLATAAAGLCDERTSGTEYSAYVAAECAFERRILSADPVNTDDALARLAFMGDNPVSVLGMAEEEYRQLILRLREDWRTFALHWDQAA